MAAFKLSILVFQTVAPGISTMFPCNAQHSMHDRRLCSPLSALLLSLLTLQVFESLLATCTERPLALTQCAVLPRQSSCWSQTQQRLSPSWVTTLTVAPSRWSHC